MIPIRLREDHNGWHAYRHLLTEVGLTSDYNYYSYPERPSHFVSADKMARLVELIESKFGIKLTKQDKQAILAMRTPHQICIDFPNLFSPANYPNLRSDFAPE